jgi:hypothetical protein
MTIRKRMLYPNVPAPQHADPTTGATTNRPALLALLIACIALLPTAAPAQDAKSSQDAPQAAFSDRIDVVRVIFDVRVVDGLGHPVEGLVADDFRVRIDGEEAEVEAVDWIVDETEAAWFEEAIANHFGAEAAARLEAPPPPRVVFFFQAGLTPSKAIGHLRLLRRLREMVHELPAATPAAVVAFDSHLKLHQDFTLDRDALAEAMYRGHGYFPAAMPEPPVSGPSLARRLDARRAKKIAFADDALAEVARALAAEPGRASIVLVGWGLELDDDLYAALFAARTPLHVLDVTDADFHSLEHGLRFLADVTGGSYSNTRAFPDREVARVQELLSSGYYRLTVVRPGSTNAKPEVRVTLRDWTRYRQVLAPGYLDLAPAR